MAAYRPAPGGGNPPGSYGGNAGNYGGNYGNSGNPGRGGVGLGGNFGGSPGGGGGGGNYGGNYGGGGGPRVASQSNVQGGRQVRLRVVKVQDRALQSRLIYTNRCAVSSLDFPRPADRSDVYVMIRGGQPAGEYVVVAEPRDEVQQGCISLSDPQRSWARIGMTDQFVGEIYDPFSQGDQAYIGSIDVDIDFASASKKSSDEFKETDLVQLFLGTFQNQIIAPGQKIIMDVANVPLMAVVRSISLSDLGMAEKPNETGMLADPNARGILTKQADVSFFKAGGSSINFKASATKAKANPIFAADFSFEALGIGGLDNEISTIFRRAFASRLMPPAIIERAGIQHVRGILLYGPPGTGKTLTARQIGKMLNAREPKIINGPEILNKYVGQSEENVRKIFADAEKEQAEMGDESGLHIIIFDELDAVCKQRGTSGGGTGVGDSVVNQLLTKLDGVNQLNNILLIGMTNRKDMIDEALMRPGRLEVQVEVSLPDAKGRLDIFNIHTAKLRKNNMLDDSVDLEDIATRAKNYSGAEIAGVVKSAASSAFGRNTKLETAAATAIPDADALKITQADFDHAMEDVKPAYGVSDDEFEKVIRMGILEHSDAIRRIIREGLDHVRSVSESKVITTMPLLFHGPSESGKTALAAHIGQLSQFPYVKLVGPPNLTQARDEHGKKEYLTKVFADAWKSSHSIVILDDFESLIEWNPIGPRFSNSILDRLLALMRSQPPKGRRLLVFVTTSQISTLKLLGIMKLFRRQIAVPNIPDLRALQAVLSAESTFDASEMNQVLNSLAADTGSQRVGLGIKTVLETLEESRINSTMEGGLPTAEGFVDRLVGYINAETADA